MDKPLPLPSRLRTVGLCLGLVCSGLAQAQLPNPLSLEDVMAVPVHTLPQLEWQQAKLNQVQAKLAQQQAQEHLKLDLVGRLGWREYADRGEDHHLAALHAQQVVYDFNRNQLLEAALSADGNAQQVLYQHLEQQTKLQLMQAFFNVLLADFQYRVDNEAMAVAYVEFDKAKDRYELKRLSDVEYLQKEHEYEKTLLQRARSEQNLLQTRVTLANRMGQPDARPDKLQFPDLSVYAQRDTETLALAALQEEVLASNPQLMALKQKLEAAQYTVQSQQAGTKPKISLDAWGGKLSSYPEIREGRWQIGLNLEMPLYDGGANASQVALAKADLQAVQAQIRQLEQSLRDEVSALYFQLKLLQAEEKQVTLFGDYADLYLDYSRALYENESATDLGDSMVRLSQANYDQVAWALKRALLWAQLDYLKGAELFADTAQQPNVSIMNETSPQSLQGNQS
jgi:outer membrane protein TolC